MSYVEGIYIDLDYESMNTCSYDTESFQNFLKSQTATYLIEINGKTYPLLLEKHVRLFKEDLIAGLKPNQTDAFKITIPQSKKYEFSRQNPYLQNFIFGKPWMYYLGDHTSLVELYVLSELLLAPTEAVKSFKKKLRKQIFERTEEIGTKIGGTWGFQFMYQAAKALEDKEFFVWCEQNTTMLWVNGKSMSVTPFDIEMANDGLITELDSLGIASSTDEECPCNIDKVVAFFLKIKGLQNLNMGMNLEGNKQIFSKLGTILASQPNLTDLVLTMYEGRSVENPLLSDDYKQFAKVFEGLSLKTLQLVIPKGFFVDAEMAVEFSNSISKLQTLQEAQLRHAGSAVRGKVLALALKGFSELPLLKTFTLDMDEYDANRINTEEDYFEIAEALSKIRHLKDATFWHLNWGLEEKGLTKILEAVTKWTELSKLYLNGKDSLLVEDSGFTLLGNALSKMSKLTEVSLRNASDSDGRITNKGLAAFAERLPSSLIAFDIDISGNEKITDEGFIALLSGLATLPNLRNVSVDVKKCTLTDVGYSKLSLLATLKKVESLYFYFPCLGENEISRDEEWRALIQGVCPNGGFQRY